VDNKFRVLSDQDVDLAQLGDVRETILQRPEQVGHRGVGEAEQAERFLPSLALQHAELAIIAETLKIEQEFF
jgi:hypothetical protein